VLVLEMSRRELLLEADVRLTPGAGICLNVTIGDANYLAGGRVTRVDATLSGGQVRYRAGVALDNDMPAFDQAVSRSTRTEAPRAPEPSAAEEQPMDAAQEHQILKTALRSAEAARKDLVEELHGLQAERAKWDEQRKALEQRVALAEGKVDAAARQLNAGKDAAKKIEQELVAKHGKEQAAWEAERKNLQQLAAQAQAVVKQADTRLKESDARFKESDSRAKQAEASLAEFDAKVKAADARAAAAEARTAAAEAKAPAIEARAAAAETKIAAVEAKLTAAESKSREIQAHAEQLARDLAAMQERERSTSAKLLKAQETWNSERNALQDRAKAAEARITQITSELAGVRDNEQRLTRELKAEQAKVGDLEQENERQIEEIEGARATIKAKQARAADLERENDRRMEEIQSLRASLADMEQAVARHDQDKQSWATQKERLTARLQVTEKWCADQQELLYSLRQHLAGATTLLDGWKPAAIDALEADTSSVKNGRKATA
jgi:chromosome segregation ATPase